MPFAGYEVELSIDKDRFELSDNCGGIPKDSIESAFMLGRPDNEKDAGVPTIGMYGIGMKRALFKMGKEASVRSYSELFSFEVKYTPDWLDSENNDWELPVTPLEMNEAKAGVTISVSQLLPSVAKHFGNASFINDLSSRIAEHFGYLIQKGIAIKLNNQSLEPIVVRLMSDNAITEKKIEPFVYEAKEKNVDIKVVIGFFRQLVREEEMDLETQGQQGVDSAGVSIICNDRVILHRDRSDLSGWGLGGAPKYHPQFRAIQGLISLTSVDADALPISTTKRGLDVTSDVYQIARTAAIEGIKLHTNFTNRWKGKEKNAELHFEGVGRIDAKNEVDTEHLTSTGNQQLQNERKNSPRLPEPKDRTATKNITFRRSEEQIRKLAMKFFDNEDATPARVGGRCFDDALKEEP